MSKVPSSSEMPEFQPQLTLCEKPSCRTNTCMPNIEASPSIGTTKKETKKSLGYPLSLISAYDAPLCPNQVKATGLSYSNNQTTRS